MQVRVQYRLFLFPRRVSAGTFNKFGEPMKKQSSNARLSSIGYFSAIVKEHHKKLITLINKIELLKKQISKLKREDERLELRHQISAQETEIAKTSFVIIIFSNITIESYIYDYAARNLGDAFVKSHLDKLDLLSKWIIFPELITGKGLNRSQQWFSSLKKLVNTRNKITHSKTQEVSIENIKKTFVNSDDIIKTALQSVSLLQILADKISELDPDETPWVQSHLS